MRHKTKNAMLRRHAVWCAMNESQGSIRITVRSIHALRSVDTHFRICGTDETEATNTSIRNAWNITQTRMTDCTWSWLVRLVYLHEALFFYSFLSYAMLHTLTRYYTKQYYTILLSKLHFFHSFSCYTILYYTDLASMSACPAFKSATINSVPFCLSFSYASSSLADDNSIFRAAFCLSFFSIASSTFDMASPPWERVRCNFSCSFSFSSYTCIIYKLRSLLFMIWITKTWLRLNWESVTAKEEAIR